MDIKNNNNNSNNSNSKNNNNSHSTSQSGCKNMITTEEHQKVVTEGQLKWAQFHYRRRAQEIRQKVEGLWQTPASVSDVEGALSDDGNTTEESVSIIDDAVGDNNEEMMMQKQRQQQSKGEKSEKPKPVISRGRRALLRVSKRAYAKRREEIQKFGFRCSDGPDEISSEDDDDLAAKYADETAWKMARRNRRQSRRRRRRRRNNKGKSTDEERLRRFENAFRAMMMSLAASQQPQHPEIATPTKVWSRPEDAPAFVSIDGRQYQDLKWGVSASNNKVSHLITTTDFASIPVDRQASWLVHIPSKPTDDRTHSHHYFPTNAQGEVLIPENSNNSESRMIPVPLGSEKFDEIVGQLQQQATMSQQQMEEQMKLWRKHHKPNSKWCGNGPSNDSSSKTIRHDDDNDDDDDDDEEDDGDQSMDDDDDEYAMDPESLKSIAAQYLTEFVANADEEHLIEVLGEKYRDDVEHLVEAASNNGQNKSATGQPNSQDIVRRYLLGMQQSNPSQDTSASTQQNEVDSSDNAKEDDDEQERKSVHRNQMASFAGIAARYLAEVSRPRQIERTVKTLWHEQSQTVTDMKAFLEKLNADNATDNAKDDSLSNSSLLCDKSTQDKLESIIAKYILNNSSNDDNDCGSEVSRIVAQLQRREGKEFSKLVIRYLSGVRESALLRKKERCNDKKESDTRHSIANRYMDSLAKEKPETIERNTDQTAEAANAADEYNYLDEEQRALEQIAVVFLGNLNNCEDKTDECDLYEVLRQEKRRGFSELVSRYLTTVQQSVTANDEKQPLTDNATGSSATDVSSGDVFSGSMPVLRKYLGPITEQEKNNQIKFEAISSRYLASLNSKCDEDIIFSELRKQERNAFSRIVTKYVDEILTESWGSQDADVSIESTSNRSSGPISRYLASVDDVQRLEATIKVDTNAIWSIIRHYCAMVCSKASDEIILSKLRSQEGQTFCQLVANYLSAVGAFTLQNKDNSMVAQHSPVKGQVNKYLDSLEHPYPHVNDADATISEDEMMADQKNADNPKSHMQAATYNRRGLSIYENQSYLIGTSKTTSAVPIRKARDSAGVAARYLTKVVAADDCEEGDIFAELRKQESPKFSVDQDVTEGTNNEMKQHAETETQFVPPSSPQQIQKVKHSQINRSELINSVSFHLAKLRRDYDEDAIFTAIGRASPHREDREHFACGVARLLSGVNNSTVADNEVNRKGSRASASRFLAAMRGFSEEGDLSDFESVVINRAVELLSNASGVEERVFLASSMKKLGKDESESFADLICGYLDGSLIVNTDDNEDEDVDEHDIIAVQSWKSRRETAGVASPGESDVFSDIRKRDIDTHDVPNTALGKMEQKSQFPSKNSAAELYRRYGPASRFSNERRVAEDEKENVSKNAFDRRDSYSFVDETHSEEKKAGECVPTDFPDFDDPDFLPPNEMEPQSIPFDVASQGLSDIPNSHSQAFNSPGRSYSSSSEFSPERLRDFHQNVMERSKLIGDRNGEQTIIDTDGTTSEASDAALSTRRLAGLMLSPTILTKRHRQAVQAIEKRKWDQVTYLLSANPWLAEMPEIGTNQYLLHKVASYGAGDPENPAAPEQLHLDLVEMYPAVQKFDQEGNLPLHMASAAGNLAMICVLGDQFPSGASVRNEDGMLPIHLAISSNAAQQQDTPVPLLEVIRTLLEFFPGALAIADNAGNLPLHTAAEHLNGDEAVDVINFLLDEADKQLGMPTGIRFRNKIKVEDGAESVSATSGTVTEVDISAEDTFEDDMLPPSMVVNDAGDTPLWVAIRRGAGSEVLEALMIGPGGRQSALKRDANENNALHLMLKSQHLVRLSSIRKFLKVAPEAVLDRNMERLMPIELACIKKVATDIILELLLADLPIFLEDKACIRQKEGGESWWFLACESNDRFLEVVEKLISLCAYQQVHELCFMTRDDSRKTLISCASPQCGEFLTVALLFVGRFEFLASAYAAQHSTIISEVKTFDALDYGTEDCPYEEGRKVSLNCFIREDMYTKEIASLRSMELDFNFVQQVSCFVVGERDSFGSGGQQQFCVAVEQPSLTLDRVVAGMLKSDACKENSQLRLKYVAKIFSVLRIVAKALHRLHSFGVVHGNILPQACGKFGDRWKLIGTLKFRKMGDKFDCELFGESVPPEALERQNSTGALGRQAAFRNNVDAAPSIDIWGFGKLAYDALVGEPLLRFDSNRDIQHDHQSLLKILHWNTLDLVEARRRLREVGVPDAGVDLITRCLSQDPDSRPSSMNEILRSDIWEERPRPETESRMEPSNLHEC